jgi:hypothetical protein
VLHGNTADSQSQCVDDLYDLPHLFFNTDAGTGDVSLEDALKLLRFWNAELPQHVPAYVLHMRVVVLLPQALANDLPLPARICVVVHCHLAVIKKK